MEETKFQEAYHTEYQKGRAIIFCNTNAGTSYTGIKKTTKYIGRKYEINVVQYPDRPYKTEMICPNCVKLIKIKFDSVEVVRKQVILAWIIVAFLILAFIYSLINYSDWIYPLSIFFLMVIVIAIAFAFLLNGLSVEEEELFAKFRHDVEELIME